MRGSRLTRFAQIEYLVVAFDDLHDKVRLSLCQADVLEALARDEELNKSGGGKPDLPPRQAIFSPLLAPISIFFRKKNKQTTNQPQFWGCIVESHTRRP